MYDKNPNRTKLIDANGNVLSQSLINNRYYFTGRELDPETGLYYYRARYYDPSIGRFLQTDPIGYRGGINLYTYVGNNPVNFTDPMGLQLIYIIYDGCKGGEILYYGEWICMSAVPPLPYPKLCARVNGIRTKDRCGREDYKACWQWGYIDALVSPIA